MIVNQAGIGVVPTPKQPQQQGGFMGGMFENPQAMGLLGMGLPLLDFQGDDPRRPYSLGRQLNKGFQGGMQAYGATSRIQAQQQALKDAKAKELAELYKVSPSVITSVMDSMPMLDWNDPNTANMIRERAMQLQYGGNDPRIQQPMIPQGQGQNQPGTGIGVAPEAQMTQSEQNFYNQPNQGTGLMAQGQPKPQEETGLIGQGMNWLGQQWDTTKDYWSQKGPEIAEQALDYWKPKMNQAKDQIADAVRGYVQSGDDQETPKSPLERVTKKGEDYFSQPDVGGQGQYIMLDEGEVKKQRPDAFLGQDGFWYVIENGKRKRLGDEQGNPVRAPGY